MRGSRKADFKSEGVGLVVRLYTTTYMIISSDGTDDEDDVYNTTGLPALGSSFVGDNGNTDTGAYVVSRRITDHDQTRKVWLVEVSWDSQVDPTKWGSDVMDPQDWAPEIEWDTEAIQTTPIYDTSSDLILNAAGDPFTEPPVLKTEHISTLRYTRWELGFTSAIQDAYSGKINSDIYLGYPVGSALMGGIQARAEFIAGVQFWRVTYPIKFAPKTRTASGLKRTWDVKSFNRGPMFIKAGVKVSAMTEKGASSVDLDPIFGEYSDSPSPVSFTVYESVAFNPLLS